MWFKNLFVYQLQDIFAFNAEELHEILEAKAFTPCGNDQRESMGWTAPIAGGESLTHAADGCILLSLAHQKRLLPACVIKEGLDERCQQIHDDEGRKVGGKEKKEIREQIEFELLPRAFTQTKKLDAWIDTKNNWLIINTSSSTQAELFAGYLRKTIDSLLIVTPETKISPMSLMTDWLQTGVLAPKLGLGEAVELISQGEDKSVASFKKHELMAEEVQSNLANGKLVSKLQLYWDNKIGFTLTDGLVIKGLKFLDIYDEQLDDHDPESFAEKIDIEFALMTGEVSQLLSDLMAAFSPDVSKEEATAATFPDIDSAGKTAGAATDFFYPKLVDVVKNSDCDIISTSWIQQAMQVSYVRAAAMIEQLEADGILTSVTADGARHVVRGAK